MIGHEGEAADGLASEPRAQSFHQGGAVFDASSRSAKNEKLRGASCMVSSPSGERLHGIRQRDARESFSQQCEEVRAIAARHRQRER